MSSRPGDGRHRSIDRSALPDPALLAEARAPSRGALRRIGFIAAALVVMAAVSAIAIRAILARVRGTHGGVPTLEALLAPGAEGRPTPPPEERRVSPEELAALQKSWIGSQTYAPRSDRTDVGTGERVGAFQGFGLTVDTAPPGARIVVNGEEKGTSPLLTSVDCAPGEEVKVVAEQGRLRGRAATLCRKDVLVKLQMALR